MSYFPLSPYPIFYPLIRSTRRHVDRCPSSPAAVRLKASTGKVSTLERFSMNPCGYRRLRNVKCLHACVSKCLGEFHHKKSRFSIVFDNSKSERYARRFGFLLATQKIEFWESE